MSYLDNTHIDNTYIDNKYLDNTYVDNTHINNTPKCFKCDGQNISWINNCITCFDCRKSYKNIDQRSKQSNHNYVYEYQPNGGKHCIDCGYHYYPQLGIETQDCNSNRQKQNRCPIHHQPMLQHKYSYEYSLNGLKY